MGSFHVLRASVHTDDGDNMDSKSILKKYKSYILQDHYCAKEEKEVLNE